MEESILLKSWKMYKVNVVEHVMDEVGDEDEKYIEQVALGAYLTGSAAVLQYVVDQNDPKDAALEILQEIANVLKLLKGNTPVH